MSTDKNRITDLVGAVLNRGRGVEAKVGAKANVHVVHKRGDAVLADFWGENLVTDYGDDFIATRSILDSIDIVTGMKLGTGATAAAKNGAGAATVTYISGSQEALDSVASEATKGAGAGWRTTYVCTWIAGDVTNSAIAEVMLTNETALSDTASVVGDTVARYVFAATIDKQAGDSLEVTWNIDILGA